MRMLAHYLFSISSHANLRKNDSARINLNRQFNAISLCRNRDLLAERATRMFPLSGVVHTRSALSIRLDEHTNPAAIQLLDNSQDIRRLKRRRPYDLTKTGISPLGVITQTFKNNEKLWIDKINTRGGSLGFNVPPLAQKKGRTFLSINPLPDYSLDYVGNEVYYPANVHLIHMNKDLRSLLTDKIVLKRFKVYLLFNSIMRNTITTVKTWTWCGITKLPCLMNSILASCVPNKILLVNNMVPNEIKETLKKAEM
ncbi:zinc finger BED domain-containing protein 1-like, partial [Aphis craccivora]